MNFHDPVLKFLNFKEEIDLPVSFYAQPMLLLTVCNCEKVITKVLTLSIVLFSHDLFYKSLKVPVQLKIRCCNHLIFYFILMAISLLRPPFYNTFHMYLNLCILKT